METSKRWSLTRCTDQILWLESQEENPRTQGRPKLKFLYSGLGLALSESKQWRS